MNKLMTKYVDLLEGWEDIDSGKLDDEEKEFSGGDQLKNKIEEICTLFDDYGDFTIKGRHHHITATYRDNGGGHLLHIKLNNDKGDIINHQYFNYTTGTHTCWLLDNTDMFVIAKESPWNNNIDNTLDEYHKCKYKLWESMALEYYNKLDEGWEDIDSDKLDDEENVSSEVLFVDLIDAIYDITIDGWYVSDRLTDQELLWSSDYHDYDIKVSMYIDQHNNITMESHYTTIPHDGDAINDLRLIFGRLDRTLGENVEGFVRWFKEYFKYTTREMSRQ